MPTRRAFTAGLLGVTLVPDALAGPRRLFADARGKRWAVDPGWSAVTDQVMGGVSSAGLERTRVAGRQAWQLTGDVRTENNGGFVQMRAEVTGSVIEHEGVWLELHGNDESYVISLRTADVRRPWQSYRATLTVPARWTRVALPWSSFEPYRIDAPLDVGTIRSIHLLGVGRAFRADLSVSAVGWL